MSDELVKRLRDAYALVNKWPEKQPDGFMNLLALRNIAPEAADCIEDLSKTCAEWAEVSQSNYQRAKAAEAQRDAHIVALREAHTEQEEWLHKMDAALKAADDLARLIHRTGYRVDHNGNTTLLGIDAMIPINDALAAYRKARGQDATAKG